MTKTAAKWITGAALAAALLTVTPNKAQAQVGFQIGVGGYGAPAYNAYGPVQYSGWHDGRWDRDRWGHDHGYDWQAQRAAEWRREQWNRSHFEHRDGYGDRGRWGASRY